MLFSFFYSGALVFSKKRLFVFLCAQSALIQEQWAAWRQRPLRKGLKKDRRLKISGVEGVQKWYLDLELLGFLRNVGWFWGCLGSF